MKAVAVAFSIAWQGADAGPAGGAVAGTREALEQLGCFRGALYRCLTRRADALFELAEAMLCADGPVRPVRTLAGLSLAPEHRRGHGARFMTRCMRGGLRSGGCAGRWRGCRCGAPPMAA